MSEHRGPPHRLVVHSTDSDDVDRYTLNHPSDDRYTLNHPPECVRVVRYQNDEIISEDYECGLLEEIHNVGADQMLEGTKAGRTYSAVFVVEKVRGSDWVEYDSHIEIEAES